MKIKHFIASVSKNDEQHALHEPAIAILTWYLITVLNDYKFYEFFVQCTTVANVFI